MKFHALDLGTIDTHRVVRIEYDGTDETKRKLHAALKRVGIITSGRVQVDVESRSPDY